MSANPPGELDAAAVIELIDSGQYPRDVVATIARGFLPLAQDDLIAVLAWLTGYGDGEIAALAKAALAEVRLQALMSFASNEAMRADYLVRLMQATGDAQVLEALIRNRQVPDEAVEALARVAEARVQDVIVINQARILRAPAILDALLANPALTGDARRRVAETREEFFVKARPAPGAGEAAAPDLEEDEERELADVSLDEISDLLEEAAEVGGEESAPTPALSESEMKDKKKLTIWQRVSFMSVSEKVQLAFKGDRTTRLLLIRERNKLVCAAVMRNPRMTDQEVESIAGMRNVEEEVLRLVSMRRDWMGKYAILLTLCRNPKAPLGVVLPLINRLTLRDLKGLKDDKGVQQGVREMAKKVFLARSQKPSG